MAKYNRDRRVHVNTPDCGMRQTNKRKNQTKNKQNKNSRKIHALQRKKRKRQ